MAFFRKEEIKGPDQPNRNPACGSCKMWKGCNSPKMPVSGDGEKGIFILAEAPGAAEDRKGVQLIGKSGQLLRKNLKGLGIDLDRDCWKTNAVCCRPTTEKGGNRSPTPIEINNCRPKVLKELKKLQPKVIVLLGTTAIHSFLGHRWKKNLGGISKWRGWKIPDRDFMTWVLPIFHPSYVLRSEKLPVVETIFRNDLKKIRELLDTPFPDLPDDNDCVEILWEKDDIEKYLVDVLKYKPKLLAVDYEATGIKPHARGHRIASVSMCWQNDKAVAWEWDRTPARLYRMVMEHPKIGKCASNMKMEDHWTNVRGRKTTVKNWAWDTMLAAHVGDNRNGITGLKFNTYTYFGVVDYSSDIHPFLVSNDRSMGANSFNRVFEAPREDLLIYNAKDSLFTYWLAVKQITELGASL